MAAGKDFDHYRIKSRLGQGGMGTVFLATDVTLDRDVAIKFMDGRLASQQYFQEQFFKEARAAARLQHPNIIRIETFDWKDGQLYLVMDYISGGNLRSYINKVRNQEGRLFSIREAVALTIQLAAALHYAHDHGMIHRDIKPDNVLLDSNLGDDDYTSFRAIVCDFGLARLMTNSNDDSQPAGTLAYMSPEQTEGRKIEPPSDIYALGTMLYELITGRTPFQPRTIEEATRMHNRDSVPRIDSLRSGVPLELQRVIDKALEKDPKSRYQTANDMLADLRSVRRNLPPEVIEQPPQDTMRGGPGKGKEPPTPPLPPTDRDRIIIKQEGALVRTYDLINDVTTIGKEPDNDITLEGQGVSRYHARVDRLDDGYQVTDLGSTNGTLLESEPLAPNEAHPWEAGQKLTIRNFWLELEFQSVRSQAVNSIPAVSAMPPEESREQPESPRGNLRVDSKLNPQRLVLDPGRSGDLTLQVRNMSSTSHHIVDHFEFSLANRPKGVKVTISPREMKLLPGLMESATIHIEVPPLNTQIVIAGTYQLSLIITSVAQDKKEVERHPVELVVNRHHSYTMSMQPKRLVGTETVVTLKNTGNADDAYAVKGRDDQNLLHFDTIDQRGVIHPGDAKNVTMRIHPKRRRWYGRSPDVPFEIYVNPKEQSQQIERQAGQYFYKPTFPPWSLMVLAAVAILIVAVIISVSGENARNANATNTAVALASTAAIQTRDAKATQTQTAVIAVQAANAQTLAASSTAQQQTLDANKTHTAEYLITQTAQSTQTQVAGTATQAAILTLEALGAANSLITATADAIPRLTIITDELRVRPGPGTEYGEPIAKISGSSAEFLVTGRNEANSWLRIALPSGMVGWVANDARYISFRGNSALILIIPDPTPTPQPTAPPA